VASIEHTTKLGRPSFGTWVDGCRCTTCEVAHDRVVTAWAAARQAARAAGLEPKPRAGCGCEVCAQRHAA